MYFDKVNNEISSFLLYNFSTTPSKFLMSKLERYSRLDKAGTLYAENSESLKEYKPNKEDIPNYTQYCLYLAASAFYSEKYDKSIDILNELLNDISLRNYTHADIEIKLFLALLYSMTNEYNLAENLLRSVSRKVLELKDIDYENVRTFTKIIQAPMKLKALESKEKIMQLRDRFRLLNQKPYNVLEFLNLDDDFILKFSRPIKESAI